MKTEYYIGLDVHKDSIHMAVLGNRGKEAILTKKISSDPVKVVKEILPYMKQGKVQTAYEAGCLGYVLYRSLTRFKIDCRVIPPNKIFHKGGSEERVKTDGRDALDIAWMLRRDEGESIAIPSREDEAARDLLRCRSDLVDDLKRTKQRLLKFLLRHGYTYESNRYWTGRHRAWMKGLNFPMPLEALTFEQYLSAIESLEGRLGRLEESIREVAESARYAQTVRKFRAFKGIDYIIALALACEVGDFRRFPSAAAFMSYLGLVPSEYSSGSKRRQGGITKSGNGHLRKLLTEAAWHYARPARVSKRLAVRRQGTDEGVIAYADKALTRLHKKYVKLVFKGKSKNTAVTAVARELSGFCWGVMNRAS
jgi:transposase